MSSSRATTTRKSCAAERNLRDIPTKRTLEYLYGNSTTAAWQVPVPKEARRALLVDADRCHSAQLSKSLERIGLVVDICSEVATAVGKLHLGGDRYELVVVDISNPTKAWGRIIHDLKESAHQSNSRRSPFFLCVSSSKQPPALHLALERKGARLACGPECQTLAEAVELLREEGKTLRAGQVQFVVLHRFRERGTDCAPGEEIFAVYLVHRGRQLDTDHRFSESLNEVAMESHIPVYETIQLITGKAATSIPMCTLTLHIPRFHNPDANGKRQRVSFSKLKLTLHELRQLFSGYSVSDMRGWNSGDRVRDSHYRFEMDFIATHALLSKIIRWKGTLESRFEQHSIYMRITDRTTWL